MATAIVVGGGIIGLACALHLRARGVATLLVDAAAADRSASWGNAGHIAVEQVEPLASTRTLVGVPRRLFSVGGPVALPASDVSSWLPFVLRLARASSHRRFVAGKDALAALLAQALPAWRRLAELGDAHEHIIEDGHFIVWESLRGARTGRSYWMHADTGIATVRDLNREETAQITDLMPHAPVDALRFVGTARVLDPGALNERLAAAFVALGGQCRSARTERVQLAKSQGVLELENGERLSADAVVICAGVGSGRLLRSVGHRVPIIAERGYHIQAPAPEWPDLPPVVFEERSMIVSRFLSGLRAASFVEFARESTPPDPRKWKRLRAHAADLRLPFSAAPSEWMGARPTFPDYLPAIGRSPFADNLLYAFGHQHLGLTLAAITGELVAALAARQAPEVDLTPFALERF